jgi:predicted CoA-binding protein
LIGIEELLARVHADSRTSLYEHECYDLLSKTGAEAAPRNRLIPAGSRPTPADIEAIASFNLVLKVVSPDIVHKTEAHGVQTVAREIREVEAAFDRMVREVPDAYATFLESHAGELPPTLTDLTGDELRQRLAERTVGILLCSFMPSDAQGFATELYVGIRDTTEFGPIISAGLGGVEMEILARRTREGAAVAISPTGALDGDRFLGLFRRTLSYERLSGAMRGSDRMVEDEILRECFQAFIDVANHFSVNNPSARFHVVEMEVNPFAVSGGRLAPLDGMCAFRPASSPPEERPIHKISSLLEPDSVAVIGVSERSVNMGRIILNNILDAGFDRDHCYVVRDGLDAIDGVRCVPSIADLPEKVDLFVVALGAAHVSTVVGDLMEHDRANTVILIPGGLGEKEGQGQDLQRTPHRRRRTDFPGGQLSGSDLATRPVRHHVHPRVQTRQGGRPRVPAGVPDLSIRGVRDHELEPIVVARPCLHAQHRESDRPHRRRPSRFHQERSKSRGVRCVHGGVPARRRARLCRGGA